MVGGGGVGGADVVVVVALVAFMSKHPQEPQARLKVNKQNRIICIHKW